MRSQSFYDFFYYSSKIIFFFPLVLLVFGLLMKLDHKTTNINVGKNNNLPTKIFFSPTLNFQPIKFDLKGPWICLFKDKETSVSAYIKDKKIKVEMKTKQGTSYFLINNDCLYQWQEDQFSGNKSCEINYYLNFVESILRNNQRMFFDLFYNQFKNFNKNLSFEDACKKEDINESVFLIPRTILFKNKPLNL